MSNTPKKQTSKKAATKKPAAKKQPAKKAQPAKKPGRPKKVEFKADAKDGDNDGLVQDGTIHERPVAPIATTTTSTSEAKTVVYAPKPVAKKPSVWQRMKLKITGK